MKTICVNCSDRAEHHHHVVPKSKGGTYTVQLCNVCHKKIHEGGVGSAYLVRLGLIKSQKATMSRIFWLVINDHDHNYIANDLSSYGFKETAKSVRTKIKRMKKIHDNDLICVVDDVLQFSKNEWYTKEYVLEKWSETPC